MGTRHPIFFHAPGPRLTKIILFMMSLTLRICLVPFLMFSLTSVSRAEWSQELKLKDYLGIYEFPEELVSYPLKLGGGASVKKDDLRLFVKGTKTPVVFQLTDVEEDNGRLTKAVIHFRTGLKIGEEKAFTLMQDSKTPQAAADPIELKNVDANRVSIDANQLQVLVPAGDRDLNGPVATAPAPLLALAREPGQWVGAGTWEGPANLIVQHLNARVVEQGPLFVEYRVTYTFSGNRSYSMELKVQRNESYVEINELAQGFSPADQLAFRFSYKNGIDPNGRLFMANGGYSTGGVQQGASGDYDQGLSGTGQLPIRLGLYTPNSINLPRAIAFWNDSGANAILFALFRLPEWKTSQRALWSVNPLPDNLEFYDENGDKFVRAAIVGNERHWAISLIPRSAMIVSGVTSGDSAKVPRPPDKTWTAVSSMAGLITYGGGPEARLLLKLNDFSLDRYKDLIFEFPEAPKSAFALPNSVPKDMTAAEFQQAFGHNYFYLAQVGWDFSSELGANHWGWATEPEAVNYAHNFPQWSPEDHLRIRSWLVFAAYLQELDTAMPQWSMLGGHPNFAAEFKQVLGIDAGLFPKHPHAERWKDTYVKFWDEWLDNYVRKPDATTGAKGGRFTESIACYNYASQEAVLLAASGIKQFDGTQILDRPAFRDWARWDMECRLPFRVSGARVVPPEGAHSSVAVISPGGRWYNVSRSMALLLKDTAPKLANEWLWSITAGAEGTKPTDIQSTVFRDYGPVLRYDFGGSDETYLQLQQLSGIGYRWSPASNGALYYAAKGKVWSWNQREIAGDAFDINKISLFHCPGNVALGAAPADGVLYNFDFAQYYRAEASTTGLLPNPYRYRSVVMVRGDYLGIFDHVQDAAPGTFQWVNESSGLLWEIFSDAAFQHPLKSLLNDDRFPQMINAEIVKNLGLPNGPFALRANGQFIVPVAGHYKFSTNWGSAQTTPPGDTVRMYLDDQKIFDGMGPAKAEIDLEAKTYALRYEYIHASDAPPSFMLAWMKPDAKGLGPVQVDTYVSTYPLPFIQEVKGGPGDQFHIVAPEKLAVDALPGGARVEKGEFILVSDTAQNLNQDGLTFAGKVAYARPGELALFDGTDLELNGLGLSRDDGDFGASLKQTGPKTLEGRVAGRAGGTLRVHLPPGFPTSGLTVTFDGRDLPAKVQEGVLSLALEINQADGFKKFSIVAK
jgi:hypothetical protein